MSNNIHTDNEKIIQRILHATGSSTKTELAQKLDYNSVSAVTNWKKRGVDWNRIISKFPTLNVNFLKTGEGNQFIKEKHNDVDYSQDLLNQARDSVNLIEEALVEYKASGLLEDDPARLIELAELLLRTARLKMKDS